MGSRLQRILYISDAAIMTGSPVPVVITAHQIPVGAVPTLYIFSETQGLRSTAMYRRFKRHPGHLDLHYEY